MRTIRSLWWAIADRLTTRPLYTASRDIEAGLRVRALMRTCAYVEEYLGSSVALSNSKEVLDFAVKNASQDGVICEFGVFKGKSINYLARKLSPRIVHGFDSFEGLPESWRSGFLKGQFRTNVPDVERNVILHKGLFSCTIPKFSKSEHGMQLALIHVDCDLYSSTTTIFKWLGAAIRTGTIAVFDEYFNYPGWERHEFRALQEFCEASGRKYEYLAYNRRDEQVVIRFC